MPHPLQYNKNFDKLSYEEKQLLEETKKSIADFVEQSPSISDVNYATRNAHAKTYAVLSGNFIIDPHLPQDLKYLFNKEKYEIVARFSNANLKVKRNEKDIPAYGFSIKIKDDAGRTISNYPLVNFPLFPTNSVSTFLKMFTAINKFYAKKWGNWTLFIKNTWKIVPSLLTFSFIKHSIGLFLKRNDFILSFDYHSVGAYRLDDKMMKIKIRPKNIQKKLGTRREVKKSIKSFFENNEYEAEVFIQLCYDLKYQPINQLNIEWKNSPFIKLGKIRFEKNSFQNSDSCDNELLSFNPFESAEIFQPVGKIQKLRDEAYKISLQTRKKINKLLKYK